VREVVGERFGGFRVLVMWVCAKINKTKGMKYWYCKIGNAVLQSDVSLYDLRRTVDAYIRTWKLSYEDIDGFFRVSNGRDYFISKR
jgi:hypothetical protein